MNRRFFLLSPLVVPLLAGGCSILPERPNVPVRRYPLAPRRPSASAGMASAPVLLVRRVRAVPGLQDLALRRVRTDGAFEYLPYEEWVASPADLTDAALVAWLQASGLYAAVVQTGTRADANIVLELQLTALEAVPGSQQARAALAGVLLREDRLATRVIGTLEAAGTAPLAANATPPDTARAMEAALGAAFAALEGQLAIQRRG